ncbi:hypothetical protein ACFFMP_00895 [Pseudoroseomonas cervicalis]
MTATPRRAAPPPTAPHRRGRRHGRLHRALLNARAVGHPAAQNPTPCCGR